MRKKEQIIEFNFNKFDDLDSYERNSKLSIAITVFLSTALGGLTALLICKYILGFHY